ncbi:chromosome segregation protein [Haladaptatus sp. W1]|uniref:DNA double-strand break repair ATPase Rad50 n=1 Tax=Haladaptatus sp. W1 TaxID=1897478 RepID=UPI000849ADF7|nr:DNA double-strand break repair ATPase Rad50 [Haladaptatus sp. W1]ODR79708.1 chromosome segregation protein [Haladaptatus sp. W1]
MKFERVRLSNFKCYEDADLALESGITVIHGLNGSGKSSLLEACFFALYGARALDRTLEDVVTIGAEDAEVELWFTHAGGSYHIHRRIRATGESAQTAKCVLETPDGSIDGARDVRSHIVNLFRMDAEAFVNCAYVRQGEVNKLINVTPAQRQDMIDDLLQLGKLEEYRERASDARLGVKSVLDDRRGSYSELESQIEAKEEKNLHGLLNDLESKRNETESEIERFEGNRDEAQQTLEDAEAVLETSEEKRAELDSLETDIEALQDEITETEREREECRKRASDVRETIVELTSKVETLLDETDLESADEEALDSRIEALDAEDESLAETLEDHRMKAQMFDNQASNLGERVADLESRAAEKRERANRLDTEVEEATAELENRREKLSEIDDEIESYRERFADAPVEFGEAEDHLESLRSDLEDCREEETNVRANLRTAKEQVAEAERLLDAGKCPECGQPVEESPHVDTIDEDRERVSELQGNVETLREKRTRLEARIDDADDLLTAENRVRERRNNRKNVEQLVEDRESAIREKREEAETLREEAETLQSDAAERKESAEELEEKAETQREEIERLEREREAVADRRTRIERIQTVQEKKADAESELDRLAEKRSHLDELNDQRRENLTDKRARQSELRDAYDESAVERARDNKQRAENYLEQVADKLSSLREQRDDLIDRIGAVRGEIEELEELRDRRDDIEERVSALESLYDEAADLQSMYGDLRAELRQRNVVSLERMLNEVFDLIYQNDSYARIALDGEYRLTIYQKDGEPLDPEQLSGGERALFNLSLRCAIYRLLAEGIEGSAPMPPLILDEPTVFLDSGHVSQLVELVESMRELGVEQIIVVSHDDELVGGADNLVRVEKDSTTNRSHVEQRESLLGVAD